MVKHTQTIRRQFADDLFKCVWPFCEVGAQRVNFFFCTENSYFWLIFYYFSQPKLICNIYDNIKEHPVHFESLEKLEQYYLTGTSTYENNEVSEVVT